MRTYPAFQFSLDLHANFEYATKNTYNVDWVYTSRSTYHLELHNYPTFVVYVDQRGHDVQELNYKQLEGKVHGN